MTDLAVRRTVVYADLVELDPAPGIALLEEAGFEVRVLDTTDPDQIVAGAADASALLISYAPVTAQMMARLPALRLVATQSAGTDTVDAAHCAEHGIALRNVPAAAVEEVASHALAMSLALLRGLPYLDRAVLAGQWDGTTERLQRPSELTVGVIGLGRIGARYAEMIRPLVGTVVGHDPGCPAPTGVTRTSLADLLSMSDLISLHLPSTEQTRGLLDASRLASTRRGALLVNVSRGDLVVTEALLEALDSGQLGGAALDVLPDEPPATGDRLVHHPRTLVTPHAAYLSAASARDYVLQQAQAVIDHFIALDSPAAAAPACP